MALVEWVSFSNDSGYGAQNIVFFIGSYAYVQDGSAKTASFAPFIENGRTLMPVKTIAEAVGATEGLMLSRNTDTISLNSASPVIKVVEKNESREIISSALPVFSGGHLCLPFHVLAECFKAGVDYGPKYGPVEWMTFTKIDDIAIRPGSNAPESKSSYYFALNGQNLSNIPAGGYINLTFPAGYDLSRVNLFNDVSFTKTNGFTYQPENSIINDATNTILLNTSTPQILSGQVIFSIENIRNPDVPGKQIITVSTVQPDGSTKINIGNAAVTIDYSPTANRFASTAELHKTSARADNNETITITVYVRDGYGNIVTGAPVYVASSRGSADIFDKIVEVTDVDGKAIFKVKSLIPGSVNIGVGFKGTAALYDYLIGGPTSVSGAGLIQTHTATFTATPPASITLDATTSERTPLANGSDYYTVLAAVRDGMGLPVSGLEIAFTVDKAGAILEDVTKATDAIGTAKTRVFADTAGTYRVTASWQSLTSYVDITFFEPFNIPVECISVTGSGGAAIIDIDGGTLQMLANILPENASYKEVEWAVEPVTGEAEIDKNGLLRALKNGVVTVIATAKDGSGIKGSIDITIKDQTEWDLWEPKYDIAPDKVWTVEFNKVLALETIKEKNIYVTDQNDQIMPMFYYQKQQDIDKIIYIVPVKDYQSGGTYTLWIKDLKAEDGSILNKNVKMEFRIK